MILPDQTFDGIPSRTLAQAMTVQEHPQAGRGQGILSAFTAARGALLAQPGSRQRQWELRQWYYHDYSETFRGATAGLIKRVQSTPWEVRAANARPWQTLLMQADFGDWDRFLSKIIKDFIRYDSGAFIELIAPGDPRGLPTGPVVGLAALDGLRCYPTGDPTYPVIYYSRDNQMHLMHRSRVVQFVDTPDSEETLAGYGESALARAVATVQREILMNRYIEQYLDDKPPPGVALWGNLTNEQLQAAVKNMQEGRMTDTPGAWGETINLFGLIAEEVPTVDFVTFAKPPEKFDFQQYTDLNVRKIALAMGTDIQEIWELTGGSIGSGEQSKTLAQKSRGKALGRLLAGVERIVNQALPLDVQFSWQYRDPEEQREQTNKASTWVTAIGAALGAGMVDAIEARAILAAEVPAFKNAITDAEGRVILLEDNDPKAEDQAQEGIVPDPGDGDEDATGDDTTQVKALAEKAFSPDSDPFREMFESYVKANSEGRPGVLRAIFRKDLLEAGMHAYDQGLRDGGADPNAADAVTKANRRREVGEWLALQTSYVNNLVRDVSEGRVGEKTAQLRGGMWANKSLRSIYYAGLAAANDAQLLTWRLGNTVKHCKTCSELNGQTHSLRTWLQSGFTPGCTCLECKGFNCDCRFEKGRRASGQIPGQTVIESLSDRFINWLRRLRRGVFGNV